ncbi:MAG: enoyl-CoA hydratase/isomerase family protein [Saprospirales bacterium]|nr:enoyl-CoA hydratase/isomerase family protein [Saprospirales bacterium]
MFQNLLLSETNRILIVTINREKSLNAIDIKTMEELRRVFTVDAPGRDINGVILTGAGQKAFAAGADISEFMALDVARAREMSRYGHETYFAIEQFPKPVIAAVNGYALGGGCELTMACHLRIASDNARFGQPELNLGITPGYGGTQRLVQYIGRGKALELLLTGDMISAEEALRLGLVNYVVPQEALMTKALELMEKITSKGPLAIAKVIEAVNAHFQYAQSGYEHESNAFGECAGTEDFKEGSAAFMEKRKAVFKGK